MANFTFGSAGAGLFVLNLVFGLAAPDDRIPTSRDWLALVPLAVVAGSLLVLSLEAGRPSRWFHLLRNLRTSWMSREVLGATLFFGGGLCHWFSPHAVWDAVGAVGTVLFALSHGFIVYRARAIPAWSTPFVVPFFLTSALAAGAGIWLVLAACRAPTLVEAHVSIAFVAVFLLNGATWCAYVFVPREEHFRRATSALRRVRELLLAVGLCHLLPAILVLGTLLRDGSVRGITAAGVFLAGCLVIAGAWFQKHRILRTSGFLREIALPASGLHPPAFPVSSPPPSMLLRS